MPKKNYFLVLYLILSPLFVGAQVPEVKFISQDSDIKRAYAGATHSVQHIVDLGGINGLKKEDINSGVLTVAPQYSGDRKKRARFYYVQGQVVLHIRDFSRIGPILDGSVEDNVADFRSLTYSLADEEAAKKQAVAEAMRRAVGRASIALEQKGQKLGALRYMSLDVRQLVGVAQLQNYAQLVETSAEVSSSGIFHKAAAPPPPMPIPQPQKITVSATVQCAFQIQ